MGNPTVQGPAGALEGLRDAAILPVGVCVCVGYQGAGGACPGWGAAQK